MTEGERIQDTIALARWQGGIDAQILGHEKRLAMVEADIHTIKNLISSQNSDIKELLRVQKSFGENQEEQKATTRFRWTKVQVSFAGLAILLTIILNLYLSK